MSKRHNEGDEATGREKRGGFDGGSDNSDVVYRMLCPQARIGSVLGKGGFIIRGIRDATGARVKIADLIPGSDERVIIITAPVDPSRPDWSIAQDALIRIHACIADVDEEGRPRERERERVEGEGDRNHMASGARLLVPNTQIGCVLGKGGAIINAMRQETGAHIRVMPKDKMPACALPTDELVQVNGEYPLVRKALEAISNRLRESPPRDRPNFFAVQLGGAGGAGFHRGPPGGAQMPHAPTHPGYAPYGLPPGAPPPPPPMGMWGSAGGGAPPPPSPYGGPFVGLVSSAAPSAVVGSDLLLRVLCPADKVGSVIGKKGVRIMQIKEESGAQVKVADAVEGCEERVVVIQSNEVFGSLVSPGEEALMRVHATVSQPNRNAANGHVPPVKVKDGLAADPPMDDGRVTCRLLLQKNQLGSVMGRGGSIISELRHTSRANIRVLPKEELPKCAEPADEIMQLSGDPSTVSHALRLVCSRLRDLATRDAGKQHADANNAAAGGGFGVGGGAGGIGLPPPYLPHFPPPHHAPVGMDTSAAAGWSYEQQSAAAPPLYMGSAAAASSYPPAYSMPPTGNSTRSSGWDVAPLMPPVMSGFSHHTQAAGASMSSPSTPASAAAAAAAATVGVMTALVTVPSVAAGAIIGKQGANIKQIRSISGARVRLYEHKEGEVERVVEVVGTSEQLQAAQALIHAFVIKGTAAAERAAAERPAAGGGGGAGGLGGMPAGMF